MLPQLRGIHFIVAMVCAVAALRSFDYVVIMTLGGPYDSSTVLAYYMYEQTFLAQRYGYGAAIAVVLLALMSGIIVMLLWRMFRARASVADVSRAHRSPPRARPGVPYVAAVAACLVVWLLPLAGVVLTSLHSVGRPQPRRAVGVAARRSQWSNYATVLGESRMPRFVANSLLVTIADGGRDRAHLGDGRLCARQARRSPATGCC